MSLLFRRVVAERLGVIILSVLVAHTGWHWMVDGGATLREYDFTMPPFDLVFAASVLRALIVVVVAAAAAWGLSEVYRRIRVEPAKDPIDRVPV